MRPGRAARPGSGHMRTIESSPLLPADLSEQTVLDVGCGTGAVARLAACRGAANVVAVDIDDARLDEARRHPSPTGMGPIDYRLADLEVALPAGPFDHVICHNLLHRVRNPIDVIDRLIECASSSLVLDVTGIGAERPSRLLRRDYDAPPSIQRALREMPLALVGRNGTPGRKREQKFFFSPAAIENLLMEQRRHFERLEIEPSGVAGRYVVRATRRRLRHVVVVSGPTGAGKSTLLRCLHTGDPSAAAICHAFDGVAASSYQLANSDSLRDADSSNPDVLFHYDLLRPWRRDAAVHERDEGLHIVDCCRRLDVLVLVAEAGVLRARLTQELDEMDDPDTRQARRIREVLDLYAEPERLVARIDAWLAFCRGKGASPRFIDATDGLRPLAESEWKQTIRRRSGT